MPDNSQPYDQPGGSGGGGAGSDDSGDGNPLTTDDGTSIDWKTVASVATGVFSGAFFEGLARFIGALFQTYLVKPVEAIGSLLNTLTLGLLGPVPVSIRGAFYEAEAWLQGLGPLAFAVAGLIVVTTAWAFARGWGVDG